MSEPLDRLESLFAGALQQPPGERAAYLDQACADDPAVRQRVEALLRAQAAAGSFLQPPPANPSATVDEPPDREVPGTVIGPYKLIDPIGEGGMGAVWMAQQTEPVKRLVALKLIKAGMDSRQVIARFEAERQALALMDHPNIARVLDGGTTPSGRPYFVMDLVKGVPITKYCDDHHLTPRQRLELFVPVCSAIQHAHQKGIIHRDLKPSNVLVAPYDGKPVVKVIDFGVAKAAGQPLTDKTLVTGFGNIVGTLEYMSPEQAELNNQDIDTRSDIYALGVLLYELLTGSPPFSRQDLEKTGMLEMLRVIREQEPSKPSTKLSTAEGLPTLAANRGTEPAKLTRLVRGELDWIVMKALEKDRGRRYETANGFSMDVQRYLADEPVLACPPSLGYRLRKFGRRNKGGLAVAALVLFFLVLLGSGVGWAVRDRAARQSRIGAQVELILDELDRLDGEQKWPEALAAARRAEAVLAGGEADAGTAERVHQRLKDLEFIDRLEQIRMGEIRNPADGSTQDQSYARAFRNYGVDVDELPVEASIERLKARPVLTLPIAVALDEWASLRRAVSKGEDAGWKRLVAIAHGIDPEPLRDRLRSTTTWPLTPETRDELRLLAASIKVREHHPATLYRLAAFLAGDSAIPILREAQAVYPGDFWLNRSLAVELKKVDPEGALRFYTVAVSLRPSAAQVRAELGYFLFNHGKLDEAIAVFRSAVENSPKSYVAYFNLGFALSAQGKHNEAIPAYRKAIELAKPQSYTGNIYNDLGVALHSQRHLDEAIDCYRKAIELDPKRASPHYNLGNALADQKKLDEAIDCYHKAIKLDPKYAHAYSGLGSALRAQKKLNEAVDACRKAIELGPKDAHAYDNLGNALLDQKKPDEAIDYFRTAIKLEPKGANAYNGLGNALFSQGNLDGAIANYCTAIQLGPKVARPYDNLGLALRAQTKLDEAIDAFRKAIEVDPRYADAYSHLGSALHDQKKLAEATDAFREVIKLTPKDARPHFNLGVTLAGQHKWSEAEVAFRMAIQLDPMDAKAHHNLSVALAKQGKVDEAVACYRKAIELDPTDAIARNDLALHLNNLAWALATHPDPARRDPGRAVSLAREAVDLKPQEGNFHNTLGVALYRAERWNDAVAALEQSMKLRKGGDGIDWFFLAMAHCQLREKDRARAWFDKAVQWMDQHQPKNEELLRFRAEAAELLELKQN